MRLFLGFALLILLSAFSFAQSEKLPEVLRPDAASESEARRMCAKVFRLLKRGTYDDAANSFSDEGNALGIRGGGAYYSFTTGSHSYNGIPQIGLQVDGSLSVGFAGGNYGFVADLGQRHLGSVDSSSPEANYFLSYRPAQFEDEINKDRVTLHGRRVDHLTLVKIIYHPSPGNVYLLRAISFNQADIAVAFQILEKGEDDSLTIAWKKLADFPKPTYLYDKALDKALQEKVDAIIAELEITEMEVTVDKNMLRIRGTYFNCNLERFKSALINKKIKYSGTITELRNFPNRRAESLCSK